MSNFERLQIRMTASSAHRADVKSKAGELLPVREIAFRPYGRNGEMLCAVLVIDCNGFEVCTIHGRKCHLPDPEWISVSNSEIQPGLCRIGIAISDMRFLAATDFRLFTAGEHGAIKGDELAVAHFDIRRQSEAKLEYELEIWICPESYWLDFMNG